MLKALKKPPELIKRLFDCVLVLKLPGAADRVRGDRGQGRLQLEVSWKYSVPMMARPTFLESSCSSSTRTQINDETIELLYPYTADEDMTYENAKKASGNVAGLCIWVKSMVLYTFISKVVKPKMAALKVAEGKLRVANKKLAKAQDELDACQAELDKMQAEFDEAMAKKQRSRPTPTRRSGWTRRTSSSAASAASTRWTARLGGLRRRDPPAGGRRGARVRLRLVRRPVQRRLPHAAAQGALLRPTASSQGHPVTETSRSPSSWSTRAPSATGRRRGCRRDELSVQNGIMVTRSSRWPLLIDPQGQGLGWIKRREEANSLRVTQLGEKRFRNQLEDAMAFGQPLLLENVEEELDPLLDPVLDKAVQKSGPRLQDRARRQGVRVHGDLPHVPDVEARQPALHARAVARRSR